MLEQASQQWHHGDPLEAGRLLYENLTRTQRPVWAARALEFAYRREGVEPVPEIDDLLLMVRDPYWWADARGAFRALRRVFNRTEGLTDDKAQLLVLAENVAKVAFNNSLSWIPHYDEDTGWYVASALRHRADRLGDPAFLEGAWGVLSAPFRDAGGDAARNDERG